jgi:hypothetical protein
MVPVPEEHVQEVMRFIVSVASRAPETAAERWDEASVEEFFLDAGEPTRALLSYLAHPARAGNPVRPNEIAAALELESTDVSGIVGPLRREARRAGRVPLVESRSMRSTSVAGKPSKRRSFVMSEEVAAMVRQAERAVRALEPDPTVPA